MYDLLDRPPCALHGEARVTLVSLRPWVRAIADRSCPLRAIEPALSRFDAFGALWPLHNYFYWTATHTTRRLHVGCCARGAVSEDEALMLSAIRSDATPQITERCIAAIVRPEALAGAVHLAAAAQAELARAFRAPHQSAGNATSTPIYSRALSAATWLAGRRAGAGARDFRYRKQKYWRCLKALRAKPDRAAPDRLTARARLTRTPENRC